MANSHEDRSVCRVQMVKHLRCSPSRDLPLKTFLLGERWCPLRESWAPTLRSADSTKRLLAASQKLLEADAWKLYRQRSVPVVLETGTLLTDSLAVAACVARQSNSAGSQQAPEQKVGTPVTMQQVLIVLCSSMQYWAAVHLYWIIRWEHLHL